MARSRRERELLGAAMDLLRLRRCSGAEQSRGKLQASSKQWKQKSPASPSSSDPTETVLIGARGKRVRVSMFGAVTHGRVHRGNLAEQGLGVIFVEAKEAEILAGGGSGNQQELLLFQR
ncbi:uncharacterized protein DS421_4g115950 [Arachis hypogaea]|nr:uncharacterized protein DS421_4g115950 [Arachis hypogaea]